MTRIILIASLLLAGCTTATDSACLSFAPIAYHGKTDSPDTIARIRAHNAAWDALCKKN